MFEQRDLSFIHKYFMEEKQGSLFVLILGIVTITLAVAFYFFIKTNPAFYKGAAIVLLALGLLQAIAGYTIYARSDKQRKDISYNIGMEPQRYTNAQELPRMQKVMKNFKWIKWIEIAVLVIGIGLIFAFGYDPAKAFWYGIGLVMVIEAVLLLGFDLLAAGRGKVYTDALEKISSGS